MKKLAITLLSAIVFVSCKQEYSKNYVTLSGKITNPNSDSLVFFYPKNIHKKIKVHPDGTFKDTLKVKKGIHRIYDGKESFKLFLKNGYNLKITLNTKEFDESLDFSGVGAEPNKYLADCFLAEEEISKQAFSMYDLEKSIFQKKIDSSVLKIQKLLSSSASKFTFDSAFVDLQKRDIESLKKMIYRKYEHKYYLSTVLKKGTTSPKFVNYENFKGGKTSLDDLKGKYVYIDVWATWCGPCKSEIPYLNKIEQEYHGKNITFVSISINKKEKYNDWRKMIVDKKMEGIQLLADNDWDSKFVKDYRINGIPRFILIDPQGNIVDPDAPRPSQPKLKELFDKLKI